MTEAHQSPCSLTARQSFKTLQPFLYLVCFYHVSVVMLTACYFRMTTISKIYLFLQEIAVKIPRINMNRINSICYLYIVNINPTHITYLLISISVDANDNASLESFFLLYAIFLHNVDISVEKRIPLASTSMLCVNSFTHHTFTFTPAISKM